ANSGAGTILKISPAGVVSTFASGFAPGALSGLALSPSGDLYAANNVTCVISKIAADGTVTVFASGLSSPTDILFDSAGNLLVANAGDGTIKKITSGGAVTTFATLSGATPVGL